MMGIRNRRYLPHFLAASALVALALVSFFFWREVNQRFPRLAPGAYLGTVRFSADTGPVPMYVEAVPESDQIFVSVVADGWDPQWVNPVPSQSRSPQVHLPAGMADRAEWFLPIGIEGPHGKSALTGIPQDDGSYVGSVYGAQSGESGSWALKSLVSLDEGGKEEITSIRLWLLLKSELASVEGKIELAQKQVPLQRTEIEKLTAILDEGERLKAKANEKYGLAQQEYEAARAALKEKREEVAKLWSTFDISQRVTKSGKLVALARESLEKDWLWVQSSVDLAHAQPDIELEAAHERALHIVDIKQQIEDERRKVRELTGTNNEALDFRARMSPPKRWK